MKNYVFSIITRGFVVISGFLVFLITAKIFGAEGRGTISFGTSLFASSGILLSCSLGRVFLKKTLKDTSLKVKLLPSFIAMNLIISILTILASFIYWSFSSSAQEMLSLNQVFGFSGIGFFYVWFHNGHPIFSAFSQNKLQDLVIVSIRALLIIFLITSWIMKIESLNSFIWIYSCLLCAGSFIEIFILKKNSPNSIFIFANISTSFKMIFRESLWPHLDYISFNILPLLLVVFSANFLSKADLGRANFAIQIVNVIFLLATTANMKIATYVSNVGIAQKFNEVKRLFWYTIFASGCAIIATYLSIAYLMRLNIFPSFTDTQHLFLISAISIFGYVAYQFLTPIWIELNLLKVSSKFNFLSAILSLSATPYFLKRWGVEGMVMLFSLFHVLILFSNIGVYLIFRIKTPSSEL